MLMKCMYCGDEITGIIYQISDNSFLCHDCYPGGVDDEATMMYNYNFPPEMLEEGKTPKDKVDRIICEYRLEYGYPHPKPWMIMSAVEVIDLLQKIERALEG